MSVSSDDMRVFQALCAETDRLASALRRGKVTAADVAHCIELRDRYADKVRESRAQCPHPGCEVGAAATTTEGTTS